MLHSIFMFFMELGYIAPILFFVITCCLIFHKHLTFYFFFFGFILNNIINICLKFTIREPRPQNDNLYFESLFSNHSQTTSNNVSKRWDIDRYGMPSGHAQNMSFITSFLFFNTKHYFFTILSILTTLLTIFQRYYYNNHTILQILVGLLMGVIVGFGVTHCMKKEIAGNLKHKKDDNYVSFWKMMW